MRDDYDDGPADERCDSCGRLDPINCPCPAGPDAGGAFLRLESL